MNDTNFLAEGCCDKNITIKGSQQLLDHTMGVQRFAIGIHMNLSARVPFYLMRTWEGMCDYDRKMKTEGHPMVSCLFRRTKRNENTWEVSEIELPEVIASGRYAGSTLVQPGWRSLEAEVNHIGEVSDECGQLHILMPRKLVAKHDLCIEDELKDVRLAEGITEIKEGEFENLKNLQSVIVPEGVEVVGRRAFCRSSVRYISLPSTLKEVQPHAFRKCENLEHIDVLSTDPKFNNIRK